jgi:cytochrome c oxidase subunit 2
MFFLQKINMLTFCDISGSWQLGLQDPATPLMEGIINFHNDLMFYLIIIVIFVSWILLRCIYLFQETPDRIPLTFVHGTTIEIIWTTIPALVLLLIAIPSFALLYSMDEILEHSYITLIVTGHQWYWSYEYEKAFHLNNFEDSHLNFDSYMLPEDELEIGQFRLLEVDNRVVLPVDSHVRVLVTSADVLHSWAIPSLGIKLDACPGRLNQTSLFIKREGVFYGQCSEICGINHGFMPIVIETVDIKSFLNWINS